MLVHACGKSWRVVDLVQPLSLIGAMARETILYVSGVPSTIPKKDIWKRVHTAIKSSSFRGQFNLAVHPDTHVVTLTMYNHQVDWIVSCVCIDFFARISLI